MANKYAPKANQEVPPQGGFEKFDWLGKGIPRRTPSGYKALAIMLGVTTVAFVHYTLTIKESRFRHSQKRNQNYEMFPLLHLENQVFKLQIRDMVEKEEREIMANTPDWEEKKKVYHVDDGHARRGLLLYSKRYF